MAVHLKVREDYPAIVSASQRRHSAIGWLTPLEFETRQPITAAWGPAF